MEEELKQIKEKANEYLLKNDKKHEIITNFQDQLLHINEDTYSKVITLIQSNKDIFFKDHESAILFFYNIVQSARFNFRKFELILDVCVHFADEMKKVKTTDYELITICQIFQNSIYYFYKKNFFSIESIIEQSTNNVYLFIYFLPEIEKYDLEYAKLRENQLLPQLTEPGKESLKSLYDEVKSNPENHILNRELNYNPSNLHKSIRDDDIKSFQSILSLNNYSVNHKIKFSYYERVMTHDYDNSLIQIAALYGSEKIFKFLWMSNDIVLNNNLVKYAFCGNNLNIIHICEPKCSLEKVYTEPIATQKFDLLDYYIENHSDHIKEYNYYVQEELKDFQNDSFYSVLNYDALLMAVYTCNLTLIKDCLPKIIYLIKNVEVLHSEPHDSFLCKSQYDFDLFKFFLEQINITACKYTIDSIIYSIFCCTNDSFKYLFEKIKNDLNLNYILSISIIHNHEIANFLLDNEIENTDPLIKPKLVFNPSTFFDAITYYNEDIFCKMLKLFIFDISILKTEIINELINSISERMITSLFNRLSTILEESEIDSLKKIYSEIKNSHD